MAAKFKIKKGDKVIVVTGRDKGRQGEVLGAPGGSLFALGINMGEEARRQLRRMGASFLWRLHFIFQMLPTLTPKVARLPALATEEKMVIKSDCSSIWKGSGVRPGVRSEKAEMKTRLEEII